MKVVARSYMWWPSMDSDLEKLAKSCTACQAVKSAPSAAPLHPWLWADQPWQCIHIDYCGGLNLYCGCICVCPEIFVSCMLGAWQLSHGSNLYSKNSYLCDSLLVCLFW